MPLLNYTTSIDTYKTIGEISSILVKHGAQKILTEYDDRGRIIALSFVVSTPHGMQGIRLPANVEAVQKILIRQKVKSEREQAERVAWRILKDWIEAQMAILESEQVRLEQIFLPYMMNKNGQTFYEVYCENNLLLE